MIFIDEMMAVSSITDLVFSIDIIHLYYHFCGISIIPYFILHIKRMRVWYYQLFYVMFGKTSNLKVISIDNNSNIKLFDVCYSINNNTHKTSDIVKNHRILSRDRLGTGLRRVTIIYASILNSSKQFTFQMSISITSKAILFK